MGYVIRVLGLLLLLGLAGCTKEQSGNDGKAPTSPIRLQLNWFHDPTFAGEYRAADQLAVESYRCDAYTLETADLPPPRPNGSCLGSTLVARP